jgi:hypothetical protein
MLSKFNGVTFACRTSCLIRGKVVKTYEYIRRAFINQLEGKGFSIVEVFKPLSYG